MITIVESIADSNQMTMINALQESADRIARGNCVFRR